MTNPSAGSEASPLSSCTSATSKMRSSSSSTPVPTLAEIAAHGTSPPYFSRKTFCSKMEETVRCMSAFGLSILLIATMKGILASRISCNASSVCALTPSSAALVRRYFLRNAALFFLDGVRFANEIAQGGFTVVEGSQNRHYGRTLDDL